MKFVVLAAAAFACLAPATASAQTAPAAPAATAPAAAAKFNLDTPIEALVADPQAKVVLEANLPGTAAHPSYDMFKAMSLRAVQPFSEGKVTDEILKKVEADLAAIK
ncbi:hypothetical protein [Sphingomonas sp.]|jgi:uncharacterized protein YdeI (BOF family)|uniref:hypothetical protein n=1 Tax=Sphingomonas sp. TaxID=28214 RepID=UPI002EDB9751